MSNLTALLTRFAVCAFTDFISKAQTEDIFIYNNIPADGTYNNWRRICLGSHAERFAADQEKKWTITDISICLTGAIDANIWIGIIDDSGYVVATSNVHSILNNTVFDLLRFNFLPNSTSRPGNYYLSEFISITGPDDNMEWFMKDDVLHFKITADIAAARKHAQEPGFTLWSGGGNLEGDLK